MSTVVSFASRNFKRSIYTKILEIVIKEQHLSFLSDGHTFWNAISHLSLSVCVSRGGLRQGKRLLRTSGNLGGPSDICEIAFLYQLLFVLCRGVK